MSVPSDSPDTRTGLDGDVGQADRVGHGDVTIFGPDFPFAYDDWLRHPAGLGSIPEDAYGKEVAIVGGGIAGLVAGYELMRLGLRPVVYESGRIGGRLRSQPFEGAPADVVAELGGMRFPISSTAFYHYLDLVGLKTRAFPNPLTEAAGSTVVDIEGETFYARSLDDLPAMFREVADAWAQALMDAGFGEIQDAIRARDAAALKAVWNRLVVEWDDKTFYHFVCESRSFAALSFHHRELFGQVGFGTGGWDSDFPNSMLEIFRVVMTNCDEAQRYVVGGVEQLPRGLWKLPVDDSAHWPAGTSLSSLHSGAPRSGVSAIRRGDDGRFLVTDQHGKTRTHDAVLATCQSWLLTTTVHCDESLFSQKMWTALDRTRYMQSSKTFVMVDRPFWKDVDPQTGRDTLSMTLTDRLTRGTYLFDNGPDKPAVICLTYSWMGDAMKMLPYRTDERVKLALDALAKIYPDVDIADHIISEPISVSWESDGNFLGAFKGALPGHYRYNHRMYGHFMQESLPESERGIFLAGDDISWIPAWAEGAVQTSLNAVWGVLTHFGGTTSPENPGPGEKYGELGPVALPD